MKESKYEKSISSICLETCHKITNKPTEDSDDQLEI